MEITGQIPSGWALVELEHVLDYVQPTKYIVESTEYNDNFSIPVLTAGKSFIIGYTNEENGVFDENLPVIIFDDFTTSSKFVNFRFKVKSSAMKILLPSTKEVNIKYFFYLMQIIYLKVDTHKRYWISEYSKIKVPLAPLPEQQRIVDEIEKLFSELDNAIENFKVVQQKLKVYRQAVLKSAFEGDMTEEWRKKQPELKSSSELLKLIENEYIEILKDKINTWQIDSIRAKNEGRRPPTKPQIRDKKIEPEKEELANLCDVPEGWVYVYLNCLGDLGRGKSKHRPRNDPKLFENGTYPFIQTGEVKAASKFIKQFSTVYNDFGLSQSKLWPIGTLCITIAANIAESAFLAIDACFPDSVVGFKAFNNTVLPEYVFYFMESAKLRIAAYAPSTAQKNINLETLENLIIPLCSVAEQDAIIQEIESRLSVCDKMEEAVEQSLIKVEAMRQSILKKAFRGNLIPQDPNDEPAEKLLDRIRAEKEEQKPEIKTTKRRVKK